MLIETEGIILRQTKTINGKKILLMFTPKYGKISVGMNETSGGKQKSTLYARPFTYGNYNIYKSKESYNLSSAQVLDSHYAIGEDLDKYFVCSFILEITEKVLIEGEMQVRIFELLKEILKEIEVRDKKLDTITNYYLVKLIDILGIFPNISFCTNCGNIEKDLLTFFDISSGGVLCKNCAAQIINVDTHNLIFETGFDIINILGYYKKEPIDTFRKIGLDDEISKKFKKILVSYIKYHFDISNLKSETFDVNG